MVNLVICIKKKNKVKGLYLFILCEITTIKSKTNSQSTHVPGNSLEEWIDVGYACPVLFRDKHLIYLYIDTLQNQPLSLQKNVSKNKLSVTSSPQIKQVLWIHRPFTSFIFEEKKNKIKNLYLQPLPVESVEVFGAPFDLAFIWFLLRVYANVDFQTVRRKEGLAAPMLVTNKCVFTYNKSGLLKFILKNFCR